MTGFGRQGAGTTSAGFGSPSRGSEEGGVVLRDTQTGASFGSRKIDPRTGDYELDENGRLVGMPNTRQLVLLAVLAAKPELARIDRLSASFERAASAVLTEHCKPIVDQGAIQVLGVSNVRMGVRGGLGQGQAIYKFRWRDLTTNTEQSTDI